MGAKGFAAYWKARTPEQKKVRCTLPSNLFLSDTIRLTPFSRTKLARKNLCVIVALVTNHTIYLTSYFYRLNQGRNKFTVCVVEGGGWVGEHTTRQKRPRVGRTEVVWDVWKA